MPYRSGKHHSLFYFVVIRKKFIQRRINRWLIDFRKKAERTEIHSEHRDFSVNHITRCLKKRSVSSEYQNTLCSLRDQVRICIMICALCLTLRLLHLTLFAVIFQILYDLLRKSQILIFVTICYDIKLVHLFCLP